MLAPWMHIIGYGQWLSPFGNEHDCGLPDQEPRTGKRRIGVVLGLNTGAGAKARLLRAWTRNKETAGKAGVRG